ncbi:MAG: hypothetical protein RR478_00855 [Bacilli bacterium]
MATSKIYEVNLSVNGINKLINRLKQLQDIYKSEEFIKYIADKAEKLLNEITESKLSTKIDDEDDIQHYRTNHKILIQNGEIFLYNDTVININDKNMSEEAKAKYGSKLSLAKIVEYGTGFTGKISEASKFADNWEYDKNNHSYKGWGYTDEKGISHWTNGMAGKLIFHTLKLEVENYLPSWINEYINLKIK